MSREIILPGINNFGTNHEASFPPIEDIYVKSLTRLVLMQENGVTHFYGCPLDLGPERNVWMSPIEVDDGKDFSYFQILYVNTNPQEAFNNHSLPVSILEINETGYKLGTSEDEGHKLLMEQFSGDQKHVLIRHCNTGMAYYPRSIVPTDDVSKSANHLEKIIAATGLNEPESVLSLGDSFDENVEIGTNLLQTAYSNKYKISGGYIYSYGIVLDNDPWKYYELFTPHEVEKMPKQNLLVRIDSGCDIGQVYDDSGCDCREQIHTALNAMQKNGDGAIIHIPSQDGRGFGSATKMETEGLKRGIKVATNHIGARAVDTITAAQSLLGAEFDIRTYGGAGRILGMIGVGSVILQTDNRLKANGLISSGIDVIRKATKTKGSNGCLHHVEAKHRHTDIYYGKDES